MVEPYLESLDFISKYQDQVGEDIQYIKVRNETNSSLQITTQEETFIMYSDTLIISIFFEIYHYWPHDRRCLFLI